MLVLTRKLGGEILINGGEIIIRVVAIRGDKVRIGIEAPRQIDVHRKEVYEAIKRAEKCASGQACDKIE